MEVSFTNGYITYGSVTAPTQDSAERVALEYLKAHGDFSRRSGPREKALSALAPLPKRIVMSTSEMFSGVDLFGKRVLDVGAGNGYQSLYAAKAGADEVVALEPESAGSRAVEFSTLERIAEDHDVVDVVNDTLQSYERDGAPFDIVLLKNAINHLDEDACIDLHRSDEAQQTYHPILEKLSSFVAPRGVVIIRDASSADAWSDLGLSNPFSTGIERQKHQHPRVWSTMLAQHGFSSPSVQWTSTFARLPLVGRFFRNRPAAYLTTNIFILQMEKSDESQR